MSVVLGVNAVFHDPAAALLVDGHVVAAAEEERFSRRKHGKSAVPFSTWELPEEAARWCLESNGLVPSDVDAVAYSYDPGRGMPLTEDPARFEWEGLRTLYAQRAPLFLRTALPGLDITRVHHVPHHVSHAASAYLAGPHRDCSVLVLDGRGEATSGLVGRSVDGDLEVLAEQRLPHSLGLLYEEVTEHLGFRRSSDEYKVMALASYGQPRFADVFERAVWATPDGGFRVDPIDLGAMAPARGRHDPITDDHRDLASSLQNRLEEVVLDLARWVHGRTGDGALVMAGGVALNCVSNARLAAEGPFAHVWVQPAAGDSGTALGAAMYVAHQLGDRVQPMGTAALGRSWTDEEIEHILVEARVGYRRPDDVAEAVAEHLAADDVVGWFQGRSEWGPRALGNRSLLADPRSRTNLERLNIIKGREQFRPVAPMVLRSRVGEIFHGVDPSPYMLFVHEVDPAWRDRIPAVVHVDGTARAQTVDPGDDPLMARVIEAFAERTGVPVVVNTSFNTAGRPMVDSPMDALECFGSTPLEVLALGPFLVERGRAW